MFKGYKNEFKLMPFFQKGWKKMENAWSSGGLNKNKMIFCIAKENLEKQKKNGVIVFLSFLLGEKEKYEKDEENKMGLA